MSSENLGDSHLQVFGIMFILDCHVHLKKHLFQVLAHMPLVLSPQ
jgi:hypothetical protein